MFIIFFQFSFAQTENWQWANSAGGEKWDFGNDVATDASGNVYITGYFASSTIAFGATTLTIPEAPSMRIYLLPNTMSPETWCGHKKPVVTWEMLDRPLLPTKMGMYM